VNISFPISKVNLATYTRNQTDSICSTRLQKIASGSSGFSGWYLFEKLKNPGYHTVVRKDQRMLASKSLTWVMKTSMHTMEASLDPLFT